VAATAGPADPNAYWAASVDLGSHLLERQRAWGPSAIPADGLQCAFQIRGPVATFMSGRIIAALVQA
jgi:hypothetical protein